MHNLKLFNFLWIFVIILSFSWAFSLTTLNKEGFDSLVNTNQVFGVVRLIKDKNNNIVSEPPVNFTFWENALPKLKKHNLNLYVASCIEKSKDSLCQNVSRNPTLSIFKKGRLVLNLKTESILSYQQAESTILRHLKNHSLKNIKEIDDWQSLINKNKGKYVVFVFIVSPMSRVLKFISFSESQFNDRTLFAYTRDEKVATAVLGLNIAIEKDEVWLGRCSSNTDENQCRFYLYSRPLSNVNLLQTFKATSEPLVTELAASSPADTFQSFVDAAFGNSSDVFLFAAGKQKEDKVRTLAQSSCLAALGQARCLLVTGDLQSSKWFQHKVDESRIFLSILTHQFYAKNRGGLLHAETYEEIDSYWTALDILRQQVRQKITKDGGDLLVQSEQEEDVKTVFDVQDDPVAYSVHNHKPLLDLYLFDFVSLPRLTDVTYESTMKSGKYAAILFTLEFNAKSLAALAHFFNIHKELANSDGNSSMYRVECFDWPDVCAKAKVTTFPRMFLHRPFSDDRRATEYTGTWSHAAMKRSIVLHSLSWPTLNPEDIPSWMDGVVYGLVTTDKGDEVFRQVAAKLGHQYAFCLVRDERVARKLASDVEAEWPKRNALIATSGGQFHNSIQPFETADHVFGFISEVFRPKSLTEMTEYNFENFLNARVPLFVQYVSEIPTDTDREISEMLHQISSAYKDKANFVWMNTKKNSPGAYTLHLYSNGNPPSFPVAFISKEKTVSLKSFQVLSSKTEMTQWIDHCLSGDAPISYLFSTAVWSSRLEGYDYLSFMKIDKLIADHPPFQVKPSPVKQNKKRTKEVVQSFLPPHSEL